MFAPLYECALTWLLVTTLRLRKMKSNTCLTCIERARRFGCIPVQQTVLDWSFRGFHRVRTLRVRNFSIPAEGRFQAYETEVVRIPVQPASPSSDAQAGIGNRNQRRHHCRHPLTSANRMTRNAMSIARAARREYILPYLPLDSFAGAGRGSEFQPCCSKTR